MPAGPAHVPSPSTSIGRATSMKQRDGSLDIPGTMGTKDQSIPAELETPKKDDPMNSEQLLNELIATSRREAIVDKQLEQDILNGAEETTTTPAKDADGKQEARSPVLVPAVSRDIKVDVALPRRKRKLQRSATSSLGDADDERLMELSRPIEPVLTANDPEEMSRRFSEKLHQCAMPLDQFIKYNPTAGEAVRRSSLEELVEVIEGSEQSTFLTNEYLPDIIRLVKANIFRDLPQAPRIIPFEEYDPEDVVNTEWESLNNVYKIIFRVLCHHFKDTSVLIGLWNVKTMKKLVALLLDNVVDARERRFAKIVLHRTYAKLRDIRDPIRKIIGHAFADFVHDPNCLPVKGPAGIAELLEIYSSLVQGFKFPIKAEHIKFVKSYVLPLTKAPLLHFSWYKIALIDCFKHLVNKQPNIADSILVYIYKYWPWLSHKKQASMLIFVEAILDGVWLQTEVMRMVVPKLLKFLQRLLTSSNYTVIEASFSLWENDHLVTAVWEAFNKQAMESLKVPLQMLGRPEVWSIEVRYNSAGVLELLEDLSTMSL